MEDKFVWGYFNGEPKYTEEDWIYSIRDHGACESDEELIALAQKISGNWFDAGWHRTFTTYYIDMYEFQRNFTRAERKRLHELQAEAIAAEKAADDAREWRFKERYYWADNSIEEVWVDKDGIEKIVTIEYPHGDAC